jgi:hypothetical protein
MKEGCLTFPFVFLSITRPRKVTLKYEDENGDLQEANLDGMITAFDRIEAAGDMQPSLVAGGIKVALLTTVFGLIVAIILQVFYNYIVAKIDSIVNDMEDASITLIDILSAQKK